MGRRGTSRQGGHRQGKARDLVVINNGADMETTEYPIRTDHLEKGSIVSAHIIEEAFHVKRGTDAYGLAAMRAAEYISKRFEERGEIVTVSQRKHDLVVLTDEEAVEHNERSFNSGLRKAAKSHHRSLGIDRSAIVDDKVLKAHDRGLEKQGRILSSIREARRPISPKPRERMTPELGSGKSPK